MRVFDGDAAWVRELEESIFCRCPVPAKRLIQYKVFVNDLHDLVLRGLCSGCNTIAARYMESGRRGEGQARHTDKVDICCSHSRIIPFTTARTFSRSSGCSWPSVRPRRSSDTERSWWQRAKES